MRCATNGSMIAGVAQNFQKDKRWLVDSQVVKLGRGASGWKGWVQSFKKRWFLVKRIGDKKKQGKVPGQAVIDANQLEYQA